MILETAAHIIEDYYFGLEVGDTALASTSRRDLGAYLVALPGLPADIPGVTETLALVRSILDA